MLEKKWLCNLSKMVLWNRSALFIVSCSKGGKHVITIEGKSSWNNLKCAWKGSEPKLVASIAFKKKVPIQQKFKSND